MIDQAIDALLKQKQLLEKLLLDPNQTDEERETVKEAYVEAMMQYNEAVNKELLGNQPDFDACVLQLKSTTTDIEAAIVRDDHRAEVLKKVASGLKIGNEILGMLV